MKDVGCQNRLVPFKVKNEDDLVTMMRTMFIHVCIAIIDPGDCG